MCKTNQAIEQQTTATTGSGEAQGQKEGTPTGRCLMCACVCVRGVSC
jgi:hypothetical protein